MFLMRKVNAIISVAWLCLQLKYRAVDQLILSRQWQTCPMCPLILMCLNIPLHISRARHFMFKMQLHTHSAVCLWMAPSGINFTEAPTSISIPQEKSRVWRVTSHWSICHSHEERGKKSFSFAISNSHARTICRPECVCVCVCCLIARPCVCHYVCWPAQGTAVRFNITDEEQWPRIKLQIKTTVWYLCFSRLLRRSWNLMFLYIFNSDQWFKCLF